MLRDIPCTVRLAGFRPALSLLLVLASCASAQEVPVTRVSGGDVRVASSAGRTVVEVTSAGGIGSAVLRLSADDCRRPVVFRFHLKGLEQFVLRYADTQFEVSLSSSDLDRPPLVTATVAGIAVPDAAGDPRYRVDIREGDPIEIDAPADFARAACDECSISWVDFFRH